MTLRAVGRFAGRGWLAAGVTVLALAVGVVVAVSAGWNGAGACSGSAADPTLASSPPDALCFSLVRTLALRMGAVTAAATAIVVLMAVGLARTASLDRPGSLGVFPRIRSWKNDSANPPRPAGAPAKEERR